MKNQKNKTKKILSKRNLIWLGAVLATASPIIGVISCGTDNTTSETESANEKPVTLTSENFPDMAQILKDLEWKYDDLTNEEKDKIWREMIFNKIKDTLIDKDAGDYDANLSGWWTRLSENDTVNIGDLISFKYTGHKFSNDEEFQKEVESQDNVGSKNLIPGLTARLAGLNAKYFDSLLSKTRRPSDILLEEISQIIKMQFIFNKNLYSQIDDPNFMTIKIKDRDDKTGKLVVEIMIKGKGTRTLAVDGFATNDDIANIEESWNEDDKKHVEDIYKKLATINIPDQVATDYEIDPETANKWQNLDQAIVDAVVAKLKGYTLFGNMDFNDKIENKLLENDASLIESLKAIGSLVWEGEAGEEPDAKFFNIPGVSYEFSVGKSDANETIVFKIEIKRGKKSASTQFDFVRLQNDSEVDIEKIARKLKELKFIGTKEVAKATDEEFGIARLRELGDITIVGDYPKDFEDAKVTFSFPETPVGTTSVMKITIEKNGFKKVIEVDLQIDKDYTEPEKAKEPIVELKKEPLALYFIKQIQDLNYVDGLDVQFKYNKPFRDGIFFVDFKVSLNTASKEMKKVVKISGLNKYLLDTNLKLLSDENFPEEDLTKKKDDEKQTDRWEFALKPNMLASEFTDYMALLLLKQKIKLNSEILSQLELDDVRVVVIDPSTQTNTNNQPNKDEDDDKDEPYAVIYVLKKYDQGNIPASFDPDTATLNDYYTFTVKNFQKQSKRDDINKYLTDNKKDELEQIAATMKKTGLVATISDSRNAIRPTSTTDLLDPAKMADFDVNVMEQFGINVNNNPDIVNAVINRSKYTKLKYATTGSFADGDFKVLVMVYNVDNPEAFRLVEININVKGIDESDLDKLWNGMKEGDRKRIAVRFPDPYSGKAELSNVQTYFDAELKRIYASFSYDQFNNEWFEENWTKLKEKTTLPLPKHKPAEERDDQDKITSGVMDKYRQFIFDVINKNKYTQNDLKTMSDFYAKSRDKYNKEYVNSFIEKIIEQENLFTYSENLQKLIDDGTKSEDSAEIKRQKSALILDEIAKQKELEPTEELIDEKYKEIDDAAATNGTSRDQYMEQMGITLDDIKKQIKRELAEKWIIDQGQKSDGSQQETVELTKMTFYKR